MRLLVLLAAVLLVGVIARNLPHHHKAHKRHVYRRSNTAEDDAVRALQDEELRAWEEDQRVRRQLTSTDIAAEEKMRLAEEHWQRFSMQRRRGGCKGRRPPPPGQQRRRCPPRARNPHDSVINGDASTNQQHPNSGYSYPVGRTYDNSAYEAERLEHEARLKQYEAEKAAIEAERAAYEERYRAAELRRAEEEERYRLALEERQREEEESARSRQDEERRHFELNEQRNREYEEILRRHREQHENESARRRAPCPALRHDIFDGKTYEQIFLFAHKSGCSENETKMAIDMARRQRIDQYYLKYAYPVLFFSRTRGWIKINNEDERRKFEEQEADVDFERLRAQYQFVKEIEASRPHPHHPPAYTEEELEHSRKLAEAEKESFAVIDKDNNEAVAYGNEEEQKPETVIDAIVLPQDIDEEDKLDEEPQPAPTKEELEEEKMEEAKAEDDAIMGAVLDEVKEQIDEDQEKIDELEEEKAEKERIAEELERELREKERLDKEAEEKVKEKEEEEKKKAETEAAAEKAKEEEEKKKAEAEAAEKAKEEEEKKKAEAEAAEKTKEEIEEPKPVEKELPDEEQAVVEEEKKEEQPKEIPEEVKVEDALPVIPDIGDEVVAEPPANMEEVKDPEEKKEEVEEKKEDVKEEEKVEEKKEEDKVEEKKEEEKIGEVKEEQGAEVVLLDAVEPEVEEKKELPKADGHALEFDPNEAPW